MSTGARVDGGVALAVLPGVFSACLGVGGHPLGCVALALVAWSLAMEPRWDRVARNLPAAAVLLLALATVFGLTAALAGSYPLHSMSWSRTVLAVVGVVGAGAAGVRRHGRARPPKDPCAPGREGSPWWALPAGNMALVGLLPLVAGPGSVAGWFFAGDHLRHLSLVVGEQQAGALDYALIAYPRAWHTLLALMWSSSGASLDAEGFRSLAVQMTVASWMVFCLVSLAVGGLGVGVARRLGFGARAAGWSGLVSAAAVLTPGFVASYLALGFETSSVAVLALVVASAEVVRRRGTTVAVVVSAASLAVVGNTWQLLLPGCLVACGSALLAWRRRSHGRAVAWGTYALVGAAVMAVVPAQLALGRGRGAIGQLALQGDVPPLVLGWLVAEVVAVVVLLGAVRAVGAGPSRAVGSPLATYGVGVLVVLAIGPAAAVVARVPLSSYYPNKVLWAAVVLALPVLGSGCVAVVRAASAAGWSRRWTVVPAGALGLGVVLLGLVTPWTAPFGAWSTVDGDAVVAAVTARGSDSVQVVWTGQGGTLDATIASLLPFYEGGAITEIPSFPVSGVEQECSLLRGVPEPAVLSSADPRRVRHRYQCVEGLRTVEVRPGG